MTIYEMLDEIRNQIRDLKAEKRECKRWSAGWHRADSAIKTLEALLAANRKSG